MFKRFSKVGNCWISFCDTLLNASKIEWSYILVKWKLRWILWRPWSSSSDTRSWISLVESILWSSERPSTLWIKTSKNIFGLTLWALVTVRLSFERASSKSSCASITNTRAPHDPKMTSESKAGSKKSICPGKSQILKVYYRNKTKINIHSDVSIYIYTRAHRRVCKYYATPQFYLKLDKWATWNIYTKEKYKLMSLCCYK